MYSNKNQNQNRRNNNTGRGNFYERKNQHSTIKETWENPLSYQQKNYFLSRFPNENVKLSYETIAPKKVLSPIEYDLCVAIPYGKKAYIWYTFCNDKKICVLLELNRDNQINDNICILPNSDIIPTDFELGTIVSGTIYEEIEEVEEIQPDKETKKHFLIDDIHMYKGLIISKWTFHSKSGFLYDFLHLSSFKTPSERAQLSEENCTDCASKIHNGVKTEKKQIMSLSILWNNEKEMPKIPYNIRYIQYRSTKQILPHYNISCNRKPLWNPTIVSENDTPKSCLFVSEKERETKKVIINTNWKYDFSKQTYKRNAFFWVKADLAYDVYYLGALNTNNNQIIYCQNALVLNFKTSVLLNTIFRNIKENQCLDIIEESDDETDFEDIREDKYVDLNKECIMECYFHFKFKKWVPFCIVSEKDYKSKIISLNALI
jgi:hypothetical protein